MSHVVTQDLIGPVAALPIACRPERAVTTLSQALYRAPTSQAMLVDDLRLVYLPIAKNACSSLKRLVAALGGVDLGPGEDIHIKLDTNRTGMQFADRSEKDIRKALSEPDWMRFVVIRDPFDRLVSAYIEKFVLHRTDPRIEDTVGPAYRTVFGRDELTPEDFERGISFRDFVDFILQQDPKDLDSHWQPQAEQLGHIAFTHVYEVGNLEALAADLQVHVGQEIDLPWMNASREDAKARVAVAGSCDLLPADLIDPARIDLDSFLPDDLRGRIAQYFAMDVTLCRMVRHARAPFGH
ncbi:MAG: sulfotransferase family 2 domain-containing protein [Pelagibaca sp.]